MSDLDLKNDIIIKTRSSRAKSKFFKFDKVGHIRIHIEYKG
jgi:hypothetical protein